jgi:hypothetical protein
MILQMATILEIKITNNKDILMVNQTTDNWFDNLNSILKWNQLVE